VRDIGSEHRELEGDAEVRLRLLRRAPTKGSESRSWPQLLVPANGVAIAAGVCGNAQATLTPSPGRSKGAEERTTWRGP
jgi:hypothetical protein